MINTLKKDKQIWSVVFLSDMLLGECDWTKMVLHVLKLGTFYLV